ncbi:MAG: multicopper oxidase domain-containing protein [Gammaproteobacteria bacterium]
MNKSLIRATFGVLVTGCALLTQSSAVAVPLPGGTLDPLTIPKYVTPLVIPPVMKSTSVDTNTGANLNDDYDIAVRQFQQQILPGGIWSTLPGCTGQNCAFPPTTVWSYGPAADTAPAVAPDPASQFNYPAYTVENTVNTATTVDWINDLVDANGNYLPHLLPIDRSLHWANPEQLSCLDPAKTKDCRPDPANGGVLLRPYKGPVPIVTHVHGAHVGPESDGYPEAWWLPDANNIPAGYATTGTLVNQYATPTNNVAGQASFSYPNDQPSTTLWYHDHTLGMTRNNVYAGPAGFWLIRDPGAPNSGETGLVSGTLPGPAPTAGQQVLELNVPGDPVRAAIREIPVVIQDRAFNADGSLFYPANRAFFEGLGDGQQSGRGANLRAGLAISTIGTTRGRILPSDISPIWNPEAFFNVMVVNGVSWPTMEVEPDLYRLRLLNGCNSRFLNLSLQALDANGAVLGEVPFYQIGAEQSLLPKVVKIVRGARATLPGNGSDPLLTAAPLPDFADPLAEETVEGLLMGLAERADTIVDFEHLPAGTVRVRMINTAPDAPFGGFPDLVADPATSGQVMEFVLVSNTSAGDGFTAPKDLVLSLPDAGDPATGGIQGTVRDLALLEEESLLICVRVRPNGKIIQDILAIPDVANPGTCVHKRRGTPRNSVPFAPKAAVLGTNGSGGGTVQLWSDPITQKPDVGATETWELWNWSADAHPIHLHLVKFKVVNREAFDPATGDLLGTRAAELTEAGWKDTVIAYPGEVTRVNATFDIAGLYVWHCHIVEHEDNEMMVPYCVGDGPGCNVVP